jgi:hypothetical protein
LGRNLENQEEEEAGDDVVDVAHCSCVFSLSKTLFACDDTNMRA